MADFKLDNGGDLDDSGGEWKLTSGADAVRQHWQIRNLFFLGEYFLDARLGVAYFQTLIVKGTPLDVVRNLFRRVALSTPGIATVSRLDLDFDGATRHLTMAVEGQLEDGIVNANGTNDFLFEFDEFILRSQFIARDDVEIRVLQ